MSKTKSVIAIVLLIGIVAAIGFLAGNDNGISGSTVIARVSCYEDTDCNDNLINTEDFCKNPGTEQSLCINKPVK